MIGPARGRAARLVVAVAVGLAGVACAGRPPPPDTFHRLVVPAPASRVATRLEGALEVDRPSAVDALRSRPLAVVDAGSGVLRHARYDLWVEGPPALVQDALVDYLRAAGVAERVVTPELRDDPRWLVAGRIERFERMAGDGGGAAVRLELSLRERGGGPPLVYGVYEATRGADGDSNAAAIGALGAAVGEAFEAFVADVDAAFAAPRPRPRSPGAAPRP